MRATDRISKAFLTGVVAFLLCATMHSPAAALCGDADNDGSLRATDALAALILAVASGYDARLDLEREGAPDGLVTAGDALVVLQQAVADTLVGCAASTATRAVIATASNSFASGGVSEVSLATRQVEQQSIVTSGDTVVRTFGERTFLLNRFGANNVQELDPNNGYATLFQCSLGAGTDPVDIALVSPTKAYVSQYDSSILAIVDPSVGPNCSGFVTGGIDLAAFADADGIPEMDQLRMVGDRLLVALQLLDRTNFFVPTGPGLLVEIDTNSDAITGQLALALPNPFGESKGLAYDERANTVYIGSPGSFFTDLSDGGIEAINANTTQSTGVLITGAELGGDLTDFVMVGTQRGYALVADQDSRHRLVAFRTATSETSAAVTATLAESDETFSDIELNERGEIYMCDRGFTGSSAGGVRVFSVRSNLELTQIPLDVGLLPFNVAFLP